MSEMRELNERFHNLIFGITGCSANLAEQAADAITEYLEVRTLSTSLDQEGLVEKVARAIEQPFLPHGYELKPHLLKAAARAALLAIREGE